VSAPEAVVRSSVVEGQQMDLQVAGSNASARCQSRQLIRASRLAMRNSTRSIRRLSHLISRFVQMALSLNEVPE